MRKAVRQRLEKAGYRITDAKEFLKLSNEEIAVIDLKISLVKTLKEVRKASGVTQKQLARMIHSSQSRIAMLENGSPDVSLELICKALFSLGLSLEGLGKVFSTRRAA